MGSIFLGADELWQTMGTIIGYLFVGAAAYWLKQLKDRIEKQKTDQVAVETSLNNNLKVYDLLAQLRYDYDADRIMLMQFKNGEYYASGESDQKLTLTHFVCKTGISQPTLNNNTLVNVPLSIIVKTIDSVVKCDSLEFKTRELDDDIYFKNVLLLDGVENAVFASIRSRRKLVGIVIMSWLDPNGSETHKCETCPFAGQPDKCAKCEEVRAEHLKKACDDLGRVMAKH
jgi:hypothetical protein